MAANLSSVAVVLTFEPASEFPRELVKTFSTNPSKFLSQQVWGGTQAFAFVTNFQMVPMLKV